MPKFLPSCYQQGRGQGHILCSRNPLFPTNHVAREKSHNYHDYYSTIIVIMIMIIIIIIISVLGLILLYTATIINHQFIWVCLKIGYTPNYSH